VIGKLTAIVGQCELLELEAESPQGKERLKKIMSLELDIAGMILTRSHEHCESERRNKSN
jgi:hypothetical protein